MSLSLSACHRNRQPPISNANHRLQWWLEDINWDEDDRDGTLTGKNVKIAIIDSEVDVTHPDLNTRTIKQHKIGEESEEKRLEHGAAVAGIICASPSSKDGVLGIAVDAEIVSIDAGRDAMTLDINKLIEGIELAISEEVDIINISAGIINGNEELEAAISNAYEKGIVIVAASGNDINSGMLLYPAKYDKVLSINGIDSNGEKLFGDDDKSVFVPGGNIVTTHSSIYIPEKNILVILEPPCQRQFFQQL